MDPRHVNLDRLFAPRSVALVGASATPGKAGHQALVALERFTGDVFAVNPRAEPVAGRPAFPSLRALGRPVDLVIMAVPAAACVEAVREAIACDCGGGLVLSSGFAETGASGAELQDELARACRTSSFRLLGPNTAGFVNHEVSLTASFVSGAALLPRGPVAVVAQSAGINLTVSFLLARLGCGISKAIGLGNAMDVDAADVLEYVAARADTRAVALHLEGVRQGRRLFEAIRRVTRDKPVVVLTVGRSDVAEFARSHTGNLLGSYAVRASALRQAGAVLVETTDELARAAAVLAQHRLPPRRRTGIGLLTAQAGPGLVMLDRLKSNGVEVPALAPATVARIEQLLPPLTYVKNPVDTGRPSPAFGAILAALAEDPAVDAVIAYALDERAALRPEAVVPDVARAALKPILFGTVGPLAEVTLAVSALREQGVFVAESPDELAKAALVLAEDAAGRARQVRNPELTPGTAPRGSASLVPDPADEHELKRLLRDLGIATPAGVACTSHADARAARARLAKPVVAKILARAITHKTEVGGVQLSITNDRELDAALVRLDAIPLAEPRRYLIEEMAPSGLELIVGAVRDASFGPTVMLGLGGVLAEALKDTATRLAPVTLAEARDMLDELRAAPVFDGWRGEPPLDREAVAQVLVVLGEFLEAHPAVSAVEINPLRVYARGVLALDVLLH